MVDFRKKLLGLGLLVSAFTGMSYGQLLCPISAQPNAYQIQPGLAANLLRVEGTTEEVADVNVFCGPGSTLANGTLTVSLNAPISSKGAGGGGATDALLIITPNNNTFGGPALPPTPTAAGTYYFGTIAAGSQTVVFSNVAFPAGAFTITVQNIRVNASTLSIVPGANQVNEAILVTNAGVGIFAPAQQLVGLVYQGFSKATLSTNPSNFLLCQATVSGNAGTINVAELFGGAFKSQSPKGLSGAGTCSGNPCTATNGENGTGTAASLAAGLGNNPGGGAATATTGIATHGTRFTFAFAGIPAGVTSIGVPVNPTNGTLTWQLVSSATGAYSALASGTLTPSAAGTATAYYEVTQTDNTQQAESMNIPVTVNAPINFANSAVGPFTVTVTVAPQVANSPVSEIPDFTTATPTPLNLSAWSLCQTTLLFPFVSTNGVETGIALSNTSIDPGKVGGNVPGTASPGTQGACTLNFYGALAATPGTATTVLGVAAPNPTGGATPYVQVAGTSNAFAIGQSGLVPAGFSGYLIAQCNYLYGHGFAYIAYQLGTTTGATMGYTANILVNRPFAFPGAESLGQ
jgi:hypothetical protein